MSNHSATHGSCKVGTLTLNFSTGSESDPYSEVMIQVTLGRRSGYAILTIYIPSLILLIICYVTLFFRPEIFEVRVMAALTSLLVVATLFSQASSSLPKTSYFKMVDIWLLFCIGVIFLIIIFHALVDASLCYSNSPERSGSDSTIENVNRQTDKRLREAQAQTKNEWKIFKGNFFGSSISPNLTNDLRTLNHSNATRCRRNMVNDEKATESTYRNDWLDDCDMKSDVIRRLDGESLDVNTGNLTSARLHNSSDSDRVKDEPKFSMNRNSQCSEINTLAGTEESLSSWTSNGTNKIGDVTTNIGSKRLIISSKIVILVLVIIFNIGYWGHILN